VNVTALAAAANRLSPEPLEPKINTEEADETLRRLVGPRAIESLNGPGERATGRAIADVLIANYTGAIGEDQSAARRRPSVDDITTRPRAAL
jgi:hypothetical protein